MVLMSGKCPKCSGHGDVLEKPSRANNDVLLRKALSLGQKLRAVGRNRLEWVEMVSSERAEGPVHAVDMMRKHRNHTRHETKCF